MYTDARVDNLVYRPVSLEVADVAKAQVYRVMGAKYHFDPEDTRTLGMWDTREGQRITDNIGLGIHLFHGVWSLFQSLGLNHPRFNKWRQHLSAGIATLIVVGNVSFPIAVLAGIVGE